MVLDPSAILSFENFIARLESMEVEVREIPPAPNQHVAFPGDRSDTRRMEYTEHGIPLEGTLVQQLNQLASRWNLAPL